MVHDGIRLISVDFQNGFVLPDGVHYGGQPCVEFMTGPVAPLARAPACPVAAGWTAIPADVGPAASTKAPPFPRHARDGGGLAAVPGPRGRIRQSLRMTIGRPAPGGRVVVMELVLEVWVLAGPPADRSGGVMGWIARPGARRGQATETRAS